MKRGTAIILTAGLIIASLAGCGTQTGAADQNSKSGAQTEDSAVDVITGGKAAGGETGEAGIEILEDDVTIRFYDEKGNQDYPGISDMTFEPYDGMIEAKGYVPAYDEEGYFVAELTPGYSVSVTAKSDTLARYENPIAGTEYDYLYTPVEYMTKEVIMRSAEEMAQYIQDYIMTYGVPEINYSFLTEKASDMEVYEFRMDPSYDDSTLEYWLSMETSSENTDFYIYETLYVECEEDTDGWIICRVYYKDKVEPDLKGNYYSMEDRDAMRMVEEAVVETSAEQPVSDKYTPEEAAAAFRAGMEAGGMTWNPELKGNWDETIGLYPIEEWNLHMENYFGGSWGTGWLYLTKGEPERAASSNLESAAIGNHGGASWTDFYFEVTGSDEECVYYTIWSD